MLENHILLIEDDVDLLEIEKIQLETAGFTVTTIQSLDDAIAILNEKSFDCVLLDMNLHGASGKDVITQIRKDQHINQHTPIIIVSGDLNIELVKEVREKISSILVKPFSSVELTDKIQNAIKKAHMSRLTQKIGKANSVFIVDDDKVYVDELKNFLEAEKFQVVTSTTTHDALTRLQNQKFDIMLVDLDIDHRSGEWLVNLLRNDVGHMNHKTPVIIVSGFLNTGSPKLNELVQKMLEKPISLMELTQAIRNELVDHPKPIVKTI
jgi:DNA-binding response OmpR family regulator